VKTKYENVRYLNIARALVEEDTEEMGDGRRQRNGPHSAKGCRLVASVGPMLRPTPLAEFDTCGVLWPFNASRLPLETDRGTSR
jgi:hypothetical protein